MRRGVGGEADVLAFSADGRDPGTYEIFLTIPGGEPVPISGPLVPGSSAWGPTWSPDRRHLAFASDRDDPGSSDLFVVDTQTGMRSNLTATVDDPVTDFFWSPAGSHLAFVTSLPGNTSEIRVVPSAGGAPVVVTSLGAIVDGQALHVFWRPEQPGVPPSLAYRGDPETPFRRDLYVVNADGTGHARVNPRGGLVSESSQVSLASWSPDGSAIAYLYDPTPGTDRLFAGDPATTADLSGVAAGRALETYAWSPDSARLAFIANGGLVTAADVYVVPAAGGPPLPVTSHPTGVYASWISWSPDATRLAWASFSGNAAADNYALHLRTFAGGADVVLHPHSALGATWSPDGSRLAFVADAFAPGGSPESLRVWVSDLAGPAVDTIADLPIDANIDASGAYWAPTGERLLLGISVGDDDSLAVADADGAPRVEVSDPADSAWVSTEAARAWSHSGTFVAYRPVTAGSGGHEPLRVRNVRTGALLDVLAAFPDGTTSIEFAWR